MDRVREWVRLATGVGFGLVYLVLAELPAAAGSGAQLIFDLQTTVGEGSSNPHDYQVVGTTLYFIAEDDVAGRELWRYDAGGTAPTRVTDLLPGPADSVEDIVALGNSILLKADNGLWTSDGTSGGTVRFLEFPPTLTVGDELFVAGDFAYFVGDAPARGAELFVTDGTLDGSTLLIDGLPGPDASAPDLMTPVGNLLYFVAAAPGQGRELWVTDGTTVGTTVVADLRPGTLGGDIRNLTAVGNEVFFSGTNGTVTGVFRSDGTLAGTTLVEEIVSPTAEQRPDGFEIGPGAVYFTANDGLWRSDGTPAGTSEVDLQLDTVSDFAIAGSNVVVQGSVGGTSQLYVTAGTSGPPTSLLVNDTVTGLMSLDGRAYFWAETVSEGFEPWVSDGTGVGTTLVSDINPAGDAADPSDPPTFFSFDGGTVFAARAETTGLEPWMRDGTTGVTDLLGGVELNVTTPSSDARFFVRLGDFLFFASDESDQGPGYFKTDLLGGAPTRVFQQPVEKLVSFTDEILWFTTRSGSDGTLWRMRVDGIAEVVNTYTGIPDDLAISDGELYNGLLIFRGQDAMGTEVWVDDGFTAQRIADVVAGPTGSDPDEFSYVPQRSGIFFAADTTLGRGLFFTDGTPEGSRLVQGGSLDPEQLLFATDLVVFSADEDGIGRELWLSDGNTTQPIADAVPGPADSNPEQFVSDDFTQVLYFITRPDTGEETLWVTDGTPENTFAMRNFTENGESNPRDMILLGTTLFFTVDDPDIGAELWVCDGTVEGTHPFIDLFPGPGDGRPDKGAVSSVVANGKLYFSGTDGLTSDLWVTDGTVPGTQPVGGFSGAPDTATVRQLEQADGTVAFQGLDPILGFEPYVLSTLWYPDMDGDGQGDPTDPADAPLRPAGFILDQRDCDDTNADVYTGAPEICDTVRNDCAAPDYPTVLDLDADGVEDLCDNCLETPNSDQADVDADGFGDACDSCPASVGTDQDGDGLCPDVDNCPNDSNPGQLDFNNDGEGDVCDADDGLVQPLIVAPGVTDPFLVWPAEPGVSGYNLYRGELETVSTNSSGTCLASGISQTNVPLGDAIPASGNAFFYLVTAFSGLGEGPLGFDSNGVERPNTSPCF